MAWLKAHRHYFLCFKSYTLSPQKNLQHLVF
jgi:hypothetical protein